MSIRGSINNLAKLRQMTESNSSSGGGGQDWLKIKDGEALNIRFLQELVPEGDNYDKRRGLGAVVEEHSSPKDFKKKAICTMEEEGRCWACERYAAMRGDEIGKKWRARTRLYANVVVRGAGDGGSDAVKVLSQGFGDKAVGADVIDYAGEYGTICGADYKLKRAGAGINDTSYSLIPLAPKPLSKADAALEVHDLTKYVPQYVEYDKQAAFYGSAEAETETDKEKW